MKRRPIWFLGLFVAIAIGFGPISLAHGQAAAPRPMTSSGPATTIKIRRAKVIARTAQFPRIRFDQPADPGRIRYPTVRVAGHAKVERAINDALGIPGFPHNLLKEYEPSWLDEIDYQVNHDDDGILDLTISVSGTGAYPSSSSVHYAFDLATGKRISAKDLFADDARDKLAALLDARLQKEIAAAQGGAISGIPAECPRDIYDGKFEANELEDFQIGKTGVDFFYPYDFPHALLACAPPGTFELSDAELRPFMAAGSPLARRMP